MRLKPVTWSLLGSLAFIFASETSHNGAFIRSRNTTAKDLFIDGLVSQMTIPDMVLQFHLMFADNIVGPASDNSLYDFAMRAAPDSAVGMMHDWYPLNKTYYNDMQKLALDKSRLRIPFMHYGECLHGVASFNQSMFPQALAMAASWDTDLVHRVGRAIASEARSIGVHACFAPVLDLCKEPRWGRCQENWGEDKILTAHMGVAFSSGLSKNGTWADDNAVVPVMKHFAAHGAPQGGSNGAPFMGHGMREVLEEHLVPFKAAIDLGGVGGVMMAYHELDDVPSHVSPFLYSQLEEWGFSGFITADDTGMKQLQNGHRVAKDPADAIGQWFTAGGMVQYYDYPLETLLNAALGLVANGTVTKDILQEKVKRILGVKYDLGLFKNPYISDDIDPYQLTIDHIPLTIEAAQKSIVLLENRNGTLPLNITAQGLKKIALVGPFGDTINYGDYSGSYGMYPVANSSTIRQGILKHLEGTNAELVTSMGANTWLYNAHYPIPGYHLSVNGTPGGLYTTYYADTNFSEPTVIRIETPVGTWGLYPPPGLSKNNFSVIWEGELNVPVDGIVDGWLGVALGPNTTAKLFIDDELHVEIPFTNDGNILSNIPDRSYSMINSTSPPPGSQPFSFNPGAVHKIRLEYQTWNLYQKLENFNSLNSQVILFWNLVDRKDPIKKSVALARDADVIVLVVGAAWSSDGESGDRAMMSLSANQTQLADAIFALDRPVIMVLQGGRPFTISSYYSRAAAVLDTFFLGQSAGQAIADVLFGIMNPGGRVPVSVPRDVGQLPTYYNFKQTARIHEYVDMPAYPQYPFGYGLSYTTFHVSNFRATTLRGTADTFSTTDTIIFTVEVTNIGSRSGSHVVQLYLLQRVSKHTQPVKQLVAFQRVYIEAGGTVTARMELDVGRYLRILNRSYEWEVERGNYVFALLDHGGFDATWSRNAGGNVTLECI